MKILSTAIAGALCFSSHAQEDSLKTKVLTPLAMQADFKYFRKLLEETHPGLYRYTTKDAMQAELDSSEKLLEAPLPFYDFYKIIQAIIADIHCAHTYALPVKNIEPYMAGKMKTLPFFLFPLQDKIHVLFNCTADKTILPGFELLTVNGRSVEDIRKTITRYYWSDGAIELTKNQAMQGQRFYIFYYSLVERPDSFHVTFRSVTGDTVHFHTPAQTMGSFVKWIKGNPVNSQMAEWYNKKKNKHPWRLTFPDDVPATASLRFDAFGGEGAKNEAEAKATFRAFMDKSMAEIEKRKCTNLIIDVRSNSGGWDNQGVELFTYLLKSDSAVRYYRRQHSVTNSSEFLKFSDASAEDQKKAKDDLTPEGNGTFTLKEEKNPTLQLQYPKPNRFKGKVYILMDEKTYSTAAEFTAAAHYNKLGTFVGEETPGAYEGGNGGTFIHLELPNSKIAIGSPLVYYQMNVSEAGQKGRGTIPHHKVSFTVSDLLNHTDSQAEFVKDLIRKNL